MNTQRPFKMVHISTIKIGDIVEHNGQEKTVGRETFGGDYFMGEALWGDSYHSGHKLVKKVLYK